MTAVTFSPFDAGRIADAVKWVERRAPSLAGDESIPWNDGGNEVLYGTAAADWTNGATISLTPCDCNGVATGEAAVTVTIPTAWGTVDLTKATIAGVDNVAVTCKLAAGTLLQYANDAAGNPVLVGSQPTQLQRDTRIFVDYPPVLQIRVIFAVGTTFSTVSAWMDVHTGTQRDVSTLGGC